MNERLKTGFRRRDILAIAISGPTVGLMYAAEFDPANAKPVDLKNKRKARYQDGSAEIRNFYRVNAYPAK
jgi:hypothetical protein